jgi:hypothetical protein
MSLSDLASIGSFASGVAVLISLIFFYVQLRQLKRQIAQSERNQQAAIQQGRTNRIVDLNMRIASSPDLAEAIHRANYETKDLTILQLTQFNAATRAFFQNGEDTFFQWKNGLLLEGSAEAFHRSMENSIRRPGIRVSWRLCRPGFSDAYIAFIDRLIDTTPVGPSVENSVLEQWNSDVLAEISKSLDNRRVGSLPNDQKPDGTTWCLSNSETIAP